MLIVITYSETEKDEIDKINTILVNYTSSGTGIQAQQQLVQGLQGLM